MDADKGNRLGRICVPRIRKGWPGASLLVDLARNGLAVSAVGSRSVAELTKVDRYAFCNARCPASPVNCATTSMAFHAYQACMNMGTLTGAPKSVQWNCCTEPEESVAAATAAQSAIFAAIPPSIPAFVIRSAYGNGIATVQAGGGGTGFRPAEGGADETTAKPAR